MESTGVEARDVTVLRMAILKVETFDYDGPGKDWHRWPAEKLADVITRGDHLAVLRSTEFARKFWRLELQGGMFIGDAPPRNLFLNHIRVKDLDQWKAHHAAIQDVDPLEYLAHFIR